MLTENPPLIVAANAASSRGMIILFFLRKFHDMIRPASYLNRIQLLHESFHNLIIFHFNVRKWPLRTPDLRSLIFFFLKYNVFTKKIPLIKWDVERFINEIQ